MKALLPLALVAVGVAAPQNVTLRPRFVAGTSFVLEVTRATEQSTGKDTPTRKFSVTRTVDVRVVSASREGSVLEWKPRPTLLDYLAMSDPTSAMGLELLGSVPVTLNLDRDGQLDSIGNEADLQSRLVAARDALLKRVFKDMKPEMKPEDKARFEALLARVLSPANLVTLATREPQLYVDLNGLEDIGRDGFEAAIEMPNPVGVKPLAGILAIRLESVNAAQAVVQTTLKYDPATTAGMVTALLGEFAPDVAANNKEAIAEFQKRPFALVDEGRYVFDRKINIMREVTYVRRAGVEPVYKIERFEMKLVGELTK